MPITIILKDENGKSVTDALTGRLVEEIVSDAVAAYIEENDSYICKLKHIDEREFELLHYSKRAWENMQGLSTVFSAEDDYLDVPQEIAVAEHALYLQRLTRCRRAYQLLRDDCTPIQWRRFILNRYKGLSMREIAAREGCHHRAVWKSVRGVERKLKNIFSVLE